MAAPVNSNWTLFLVFSFWTYEQNTVWADKVVLWQDCLQKHLNEVRRYNLLGQVHAEKGNINEALIKYKQATGHNHENIEAYNNLEIAQVRIGKVEAGNANLKIALKSTRKPEAGLPGRVFLC